MPEKIEYILETTLTAHNLSNLIGDVRDIETLFTHVMAKAYKISLPNVGIKIAEPAKGEKTPVDVILFLTESDKNRVKPIMMGSKHVFIINQAIRTLMLDKKYGFVVSGATAPTEIKISGKTVYYLSSLQICLKIVITNEQ